jgi:hypothetical protein
MVNAQGYPTIADLAPISTGISSFTPFKTHGKKQEERGNYFDSAPSHAELL